MGERDSVGTELRVVRGTAGEEELAAVAVVLGAVLSGRDRDEDDSKEKPGTARWRQDGSQGVYRAPHSWRHPPRLPFAG
ncbi:acyl-CoA carboxylase epsilon subunit [Streptomyces sp. NPDC086783]|uniref:acyl-CoA carboxylase epsilon subunit n=1 Tax=Streptomyces sp. NPDC086783 TaxID=3365758 RepID=UPI0037F36FA2